MNCGRLHTHRPLLAVVTLPLCLAFQAATSVSPVWAVSGETAQQSVFAIETQTWSGTGFLVGLNGLILTSSMVASGDTYLTVIIAPGKKVPGEIVHLDRFFGIGVIRVNPGAVAGLRPVPISTAVKGAEVPARGHRVLEISVSPEGGHDQREGGIRRVRPNVLVCDFSRKPVAIGGPVFNTGGRVVAINVGRWMSGRTRERPLRIHKAEKALAEARREAAATPPPALAWLPVPSPYPYPQEILDTLAGAELRLNDYQVRAGPFLVEFMTTPLSHALRLRPGDVARGSEAGCARAKGQFDRWRPSHSTGLPQVSVMVVPEIRRRAWTYVANTAYWVFLPVTTLAVAFGGGHSFPEPPKISSRFDPVIEDIELLRGGTRVAPYRPGLVCGSTGNLLQIDLCPREARNRERRRVKGCFWQVTYPPEAFEPGPPLELRIHWKGGEPDPEVVALDPSLVERVWSDFRPYFEKRDGMQEEATAKVVEGEDP